MKPKNAVLHFVALLLCVLLCGCWGCVLFEPEEPDCLGRVVEYAQSHSELTLGALLDFEWDVAYNDIETYGWAGDIKERSGYAFEIERLAVDHLYRLLFFKNGELVKTLKYTIGGTFDFPSDILLFYPDTVFDVTWYDHIYEGTAYPHLVLRIKE